MKLRPDEIEEVNDIGHLEGDTVKLVKTVGGYWVGVLCGQGKEKALAAGSHPAIVKHNIEKEFHKYQPLLEKSENGIASEKVTEYSHLLSKSLVEEGYSLYALKKSNNIDVVLTHFGLTKANISGVLIDDSLTVRQNTLNKMEKGEEFSNAVAQAMATESKKSGKSVIKLKNKKVKL